MNKSKGFSLIEVLVTLVLTTIGILGMVVLQGKSIQYTTEASSREVAVSLSNELVEILRSHRSELFVKQPPAHYTFSEVKHSSDAYSGGSIAASSGDCPSSGLPQTLKQEVGCWVEKASSTLPGVDADYIASNFLLCPSFQAGSCASSSFKGSTMLVRVAWEMKEPLCGDENTESTTCTYDLRVEL